MMECEICFNKKSLEAQQAQVQGLREEPYCLDACPVAETAQTVVSMLAGD